MNTRRCTFGILLLVVTSLALALPHGGIAAPSTPPAGPGFPVRGLAIAAPQPRQLDRFLRFLEQDFAPRGGNTLILRVDHQFQFESHPDLRDDPALSRDDVRRLVETGRRLGIRLIPQINLLGHQSWQGSLGRLLRVHPEFDETPGVRLPEKYVWPNPDGLYCKSYCPLHPEVHRVVFALVDELCNAFSADAFHAGMDEVFYLASDQCPRCKGRNKAELFAGEVTRIRDHLASRQRELWIWGDRLLDGRTTGIGEWEASFNDTHPALQLIPRDVVICDWHYERPDPTAILFALHGLRVVTCPWRKPDVAVQQVQDLARWRAISTVPVRDRLLGIVQTVWSGAEAFLRELDALKSGTTPHTNATSVAACYLRTFAELQPPTASSRP